MDLDDFRLVGPIQIIAEEEVKDFESLSCASCVSRNDKMASMTNEALLLEC